jgi:hypothetical protein
MKTAFGLLWLAVVAALVAFAAPAQGAPSEDALDRVVALNKEGVAQFQGGELATARKTIRSALDLCKTTGLEKHPVAARTHIHLGIILIDGFGQTAAGTKEFRDALAIEPKIELTPGLATSAATVAFEEAVAFAPAPGAPAAAPVAEEPPPARDPAPVAVDDEEEKRPSRPAPTVVRRAAREETDDEDGDEDEDGGSRFDVRLVVGPGGGWASGAGELNIDARSDGSFSGSVVNHATVGVGYWWKPEWLLSLDGRFQRVAGVNGVDAAGHKYAPASGAIAVLATATWSPRGGTLRPFVSTSLGAGRIRETVRFSQYKDCGPMHDQVCVDTVGGGPAIVGGAAGLTYALSKDLGLVAGLGAQLAVPTTTFNLDLNVGFAYQL